MNKINLESIGLSDLFKQEASIHESLFVARVSSQHRDLYKVLTENGEIQAKVSGKLNFIAHDSTSFPAVGDWVMIDRPTDDTGTAIIHKILNRKSIFERKAAGSANQTQIIATNIDVVFICMSLNNDFNLRRLERYLSIAWDSMAQPVVILTKADLCEDVPQKLAEVHSVAIGVDIVTTSFKDDKGLSTVKNYIKSGKTAACIGSSGVGKSTLINRLMDQEVLVTSGIRDDDKGRHTTTYRQLLILPNGGVVIDTPGMRELQIESADLSSSFSDIDGLAKQCRFNDCSHQSEPGCAVKDAIENGSLSHERLTSYNKLLKELKYQDLKSQQREREKINSMFGSLSAMKQVIKHNKQKNKRR